MLLTSNHMNMKYQLKLNETDPYSGLIAQFVESEFPIYSKDDNRMSLVDHLTDAILASGAIRYGPRPGPESQVAIREVIRHKVDQNVPIPFMLPWGSKKVLGTGVDMAELMALKQIQCLHDRVTKFYIPGIQAVMRIENLTAPYIYPNADLARAQSKLYVDGLVNLVKVVAMDGFVIPKPDSTYGVSFDAAVKQAELIRPIIEAHIADPGNESLLRDLLAAGWSGAISPITIRHYMDGYAKMYPDMTMEAKQNMLARYFAAAKARKSLGLTGILPQWGAEFLELYFGKTPGGLSGNFYSRRIHYRTIPEYITSNHIAPWRSKGYIAIKGEKALAKLANAHEQLPYNPYEIELSNGQESQTVQADYVIRD